MTTHDQLSVSYRSRYSELYQFFAGYFYQGWISDYRWDSTGPSFRAVVRHFHAVNPPAVVEAVCQQLEQLVLLTAEDDLKTALIDLGSGFDPDFEMLNESEWLGGILDVMSESAAGAMVLREKL